MSTPPTDFGSNGPRGRDPETIARAIDETRSDVDQTLDALQARLSPGQLLDRAMELVRANGGQFATNLGRTIRDNPFPVILTGVGLAWMMASARASSAPAGSSWLTGRMSEGVGDMSERVTEATSGAISAARSRLSAATESATEAASSAAGSVSDGLKSASDSVRDQGRRMSEGLARLLREQPLLVGAVGIAVGALVGYALPPSDAEDRLLGEARDATVRRAAEGAHSVAARAKETVSQATNDDVLERDPAAAQRSTGGDHGGHGVSERT